MGFFIVDNSFNRGWIDAYNRKPARETDPEYMRGWKHGATGKY